MDHFFGTPLSVRDTTRNRIPLAPLVAGGIQVHVVVNASGWVHEVIVASARPDERSSAPLQSRVLSARHYLGRLRRTVTSGRLAIAARR